MKMSNDNNHYYDGQTPDPDFLSGPIILVFAAILMGLEWLNALSVQVLGWIIFPLDYAINAMFFPAVHTQLYKNGDALLIIVTFIVLILFINRVARWILSAFSRVVSFFRP